MHRGPPHAEEVEPAKDPLIPFWNYHETKVKINIRAKEDLIGRMVAEWFPDLCRYV